jgi:hypothetical protein
MKTLDDLYEELRQIDTRSESFVPRFEQILAEVGAFKDADSIVALSQFFDDESEYDEAMFSMIHLIESFDDVTYIGKLLEATPELCLSKPRWASIIFMRVLNSESTKRELIRQLRMASTDVKQNIRALMEKINARSVKFVEKTTPVLIAVGL